MATATELRVIIRILLESEFYVGTVHHLPLRDRLALVKSLAAKMVEAGHGGQPTDRQRRPDDV